MDMMEADSSERLFFTATAHKRKQTRCFHSVRSSFFVLMTLLLLGGSITKRFVDPSSHMTTDQKTDSFSERPASIYHSSSERPPEPDSRRRFQSDAAASSGHCRPQVIQCGLRGVVFAATAFCCGFITFCLIHIFASKHEMKNVYVWWLASWQPIRFALSADAIRG